MKGIYLDYAAGTPIDPRVKSAMRGVFDIFANPSSIHSEGLKAGKILNSVRASVGRAINTKPEDIVFISSGTESCNLAILGVSGGIKKGHIIALNIEHPAVLKAVKSLEKRGFELTLVKVQENGIVDPEVVLKAVRPDTILVSIMYANHEIGTIQPVAKIGRLLKQKYGSKKPLLHTDACHAPGVLDIDVQHLGVDLMSLNGSKIYGPSGVGCLYVRRGVEIEPIIVGGSQERGLRAGTPNLALIVGFAKALELISKIKKKEIDNLIELRDYTIEQILKKIPDSYLNGDPADRLPGNINISFKDIDGEMLMLALDKKGIQVSVGSACTASSNEPSHILKAINQKHGNLRITLGNKTTKQEIDTLLRILPKLVSQQRERA
ncbi:MAG: cysteine desulfurase family protein [Parcubacteria group bacterium]